MAVDRNPKSDGPVTRCNEGETVDVAIVGAGIAGLAAARSLVGHGRSVAVLESRERVGGRLHSPELRSGSGRIDLGATWFWAGETRVANLVAELGIHTHAQHLAGDALFHHPAGPQRIEGNPVDVPSSRFTDGAQSLAEAVAAGLPPSVVRLGTSVTAVIGTESGALELQHPGGRLLAEHVVLALPPALAVSRIGFDPALPDQLAALAAVTPVWMGATTKVVAHYVEPFWRRQGLAGSAISHRGPLREIHDMSGPDGTPAALFGFIPGTSPPSDASRDAILRQLTELFGPDSANPLELVVADWSDQPDTSPIGVDRLTAYQTFGHAGYQHPTGQGRIHWASTETSPVAPGHIEGALAGAERAVAAIQADLAEQPSSRPRAQGAMP